MYPTPYWLPLQLTKGRPAETKYLRRAGRSIQDQLIAAVSRTGKFRLDLTVSLSICLACAFYLILDVWLFKIGLVLNGYDCLSLAMEMCDMPTS